MPQTRWNIVALAVGAGVVCAMQVGKVPPVLPLLRTELLLGLVTAGWIISLFNAASALFGTMIGIASDHLGHRRLIIGGLCCLALGGISGSLATGPIWLLLSRLLEGIGFVATVIAAPSIIAVATRPADRRLAMAAWSTYMPTGIVLMMLATPPLLTVLGWRGLWLINAIIAAAFGIALVCIDRTIGKPPNRKRSFSDVKLALSRSGPWLLAACFAAYTVQFFAVVSWLPTLLVENLGYPTSQAALIVACVVICNILGNLLGGWLLHCGAARWLLIAIGSFLLGVLAVGIFADSVDPHWKIFLAAAFNGIGGLVPSSVLAGVPEHAPSAAQIGVTNGIVVQGSNIGTLFGPPAVAALVAGLGGWSHSGWLLFVMGCGGLIMALILRRIEGREHFLT